MTAELDSGGYVFDCQNSARWVPFSISKAIFTEYAPIDQERVSRVGATQWLACGELGQRPLPHRVGPSTLHIIPALGAGGKCQIGALCLAWGWERLVRARGVETG
jgi:hypothetical protein